MYYVTLAALANGRVNFADPDALSHGLAGTLAGVELGVEMWKIIVAVPVSVDKQAVHCEVWASVAVEQPQNQMPAPWLAHTHWVAAAVIH